MPQRAVRHDWGPTASPNRAKSQRHSKFPVAVVLRPTYLYDLVSAGKSHAAYRTSEFPPLLVHRPRVLEKRKPLAAVGQEAVERNPAADKVETGGRQRDHTEPRGLRNSK